LNRAANPTMTTATPSSVSIFELLICAGQDRVLRTERQFQLRHRRETLAVLRRGAEPVERRQMVRRSVSLVARPVVAGMLLIERAHHTVARNLGDNGGRGDRHGLRIP